MPARPRRPPIVGLRRLLLLLLVAGGGALVGVYFVGREQRSPAVRPARPAGGGPTGDITLIGQGFEYTQTNKGRKVFRIRGDSLKIRQGNQVLLEGVGLTLYRGEEDAHYEVASRQATYDQENKEALLEGDVRLRGPGDVELATEGLHLQTGGNTATSTGPVAFRYAQSYVGRADLLKANVKRNFLLLAGKVRIDSLPGAGEPTSLQATTVVIERDEHQVRADRDVELRRGIDVVRAGRLSATLSDDDRRIEFLRARWEVSAVMTVGGDDGAAPSTVTLHGKVLSATLDADGRRATSLELEGGDEPMTLASTGAAGLVDTLTAARAVAGFTGGNLARVDAFHHPVLVETAAGAPDRPLRRLAADRLAATFAGGSLATVDAERAVDYRAADLTVTGDRLRYDAATGRGDMVGAPMRATSARGELVAPHAVFEEKSRILTADGGVRATLAEGESGGLTGSPLGAGGPADAAAGPVRVEAKEALWRDQPQSFLFRGDVRAWQGKNLLLAAALRGDSDAEGGDRLTATGGVKTVWTPAPEDGAKSGDAGGGGGGGPIEVTAKEMNYQRGPGRLDYHQEVRVDQEGRVLTCRDLEVALDADGRAKAMTCQGDVHLADRAAGNAADGDRAVYDLATRTVDITGAPVKLRKSDGGQVEGHRVIYDLALGKARVLAEGGGG